MPSLSRTQVRHIAIVGDAQAPLSKDQKAFNSLIKKIDARRSKLADWETAIPLVQQKYLSDLLPLQEQAMELQLELEHIDQAHLANLKPERLKHYLKILKGQLADLDEELLRIEGEFAARFGLPPFEKLEPKNLMPMLLGQIADCEADIRELQDNLEAVDDIKRLKAWLKTVILERNDHWDIPF